MDSHEPEAPKSGCLTPTLMILFLLGCMAYLAITGEERITFGCETRPAASPP